MNLLLQTWKEVEAYLEHSRGIIVPIGSTEQHGLNGLIGTDAICSEAIARGAGEKAGALVGPTINVGMAQHHMGFPGTITLRPSTLIAVIEDYVTALAKHGFERFYFLNAHGGNIATANAAFSQIYAASSLRAGANTPSVQCKLTNWWEAPHVAALIKELFGNRDGAHATPSEVSVTQFVYPDAIKRVEKIPLGPSYRPFADGDHYRRLYPDGHIGGDPTLASPEHGKRLYDAAVEDVRDDYLAFLASA